MYGKLLNGTLIYAPNSVTVGDKRIINPGAEVLLSLGWLPITNTEPPATEAGFHAVGSWHKTDTEIVRVWTVEADEPALPTAEERIAALEASMLEIIIGGGL